MNGRHRWSGGGFTLIELLVAIAVFVILAAIAYGTLGNALSARDGLETRNARRTDIMRAVSLIERDVLQAVARPVIDQFDRVSPALLIESRPANRLELTRTGLPNPRHENRAALQRLAYEIEDGVLLRRVWSVLDRTAQTLPLDDPLLSDVESLSFEALGDAWVDSWPPQSGGGESSSELMPRAVRLKLELKDMGELTREMPVSTSPVAVPARGGGGAAAGDNS